MPSFDRRLSACGAAAMLFVAASARAQTSANGFAVERLYTSAPGGGWVVMDDLSMHGPLGGSIQVTTGYSHHPLHVSQGNESVDVVSQRAFADLGVAVTFDRFRAYLNFSNPLWMRGDDGTLGGAGGVKYVAPSVDAAQNPDTISDVRIGFDTRLLGDVGGPLRVGVGWQLYVPSGDREDYITDGTYRGMGRVLFAGTFPRWAWAAHVGVHLRPLDERTAGSPRGNELLFGVAIGPKFPLRNDWQLVVGPEVFGERALRSSAMGVEALLGARVEGTAPTQTNLRVKLAGGAGLDADFGAPAWRIVAAVEIFGFPSRTSESAPTETSASPR